MKIKVGRGTGMSVEDLKCGDVFRFVSSRDDQVYQMSRNEEYQSLKTGVTYSADTCCPDAVVLRYPDAEIELGAAEGMTLVPEEVGT